MYVYANRQYSCNLKQMLEGGKLHKTCSLGLVQRLIGARWKPPYLLSENKFLMGAVVQVLPHEKLVILYEARALRPQNLGFLIVRSFRLKLCGWFTIKDFKHTRNCMWNPRHVHGRSSISCTFEIMIYILLLFSILRFSRAWSACPGDILCPSAIQNSHKVSHFIAGSSRL